jgi:hypothetical protein
LVVGVEVQGRLVQMPQLMLEMAAMVQHPQSLVLL